jgi:hypothetical protein
MKKNNWLIWAAVGIAAWYWFRKSQGKPLLPGGGGGAASTTPSGASAQRSAQEAREIVADVVDRTTFLPDMKTDAEKYAADQKMCK